MWKGAMTCALLGCAAAAQAQELTAARDGDMLAAEWTGERGARLKLRLNLADPARLIAEASVDGRVLLRDAAPAYYVYTGKRRGGWDNFFDSPSTRPHEIAEYQSTFRRRGEARIEKDGARMHLIVPNLAMGIFYGDLVFTVYTGSNLVQQEAVVSTSEPDVAYFYNAWLTRVSTKELNRLHWLGAADGKFHTQVLTSDVDLDYVPLMVHRRTLIAEGAAGSVAVFPPPHQYFFARDETINYRNVWYRLYRISPPGEGDWFSFGIRQTPYFEQAHFAPLVNAPPGTQQRMSLFWYLSSEPARRTFDRVSALTHDDKFLALPGRKTFTSHYHLSVTMESRRRDRAPYQPEFVDVFRQMNINIAHIADFHTDGHPRDTGATRRDELRDYYAETRRLSNDDFLLVPGEEANAHYRGHWNLFLPRPITWYMRRGPSEKFFEDGMYRVGNAEEMLEMIRKEGGLAWQAHPRTKGSTGYPDSHKDEAYFRDPTWLGAGFKLMPSDNSGASGERAFKLLDDMNNWDLRKFLVGEVDVFKIDKTHELYGHMNINYLKLDRVPRHPDFSAVGKALASGDFWVTSGEILIRDLKLDLDSEGALNGEVELDWTFPLSHYTLVFAHPSGDGSVRKVVPLADTQSFGRKRFVIRERIPLAKWVRLQVADVAGNYAFSQPVWAR